MIIRQLFSLLNNNYIINQRRIDKQQGNKNNTGKGSIHVNGGGDDEDDGNDDKGARGPLTSCQWAHKCCGVCYVDD